jgi:hypothetical protein
MWNGKVALPWVYSVCSVFGRSLFGQFFFLSKDTFFISVIFFLSFTLSASNTNGFKRPAILLECAPFAFFTTLLTRSPAQLLRQFVAPTLLAERKDCASA